MHRVYLQLMPGWEASSFLAHRRPAGIVVHCAGTGASKPSTHDTFDSVSHDVDCLFGHHSAVGMPHAIIIDSQGAITQTAPLDRQTPHAHPLQPSYVSIACLMAQPSGPMNPVQLGALIGCCAHLAYHGEFDAAAIVCADTSGTLTRQVNLTVLRDKVTQAMTQGYGAITSFGFLWDSSDSRERPLGREPSPDFYYA